MKWKVTELYVLESVFSVVNPNESFIDMLCISVLSLLSKRWGNFQSQSEKRIIGMEHWGLISSTSNRRLSNNLKKWLERLDNPLSSLSVILSTTNGHDITHRFLRHMHWKIIHLSCWEPTNFWGIPRLIVRNIAYLFCLLVLKKTRICEKYNRIHRD